MHDPVRPVRPTEVPPEGQPATMSEDTPAVGDGAWNWKALMSHRFRRAFLAWSIGTLIAVATALGPALDLPEQRLRDWLTAWQIQNDPVPDILVVDISEASLRRMGAWPWSRAQLADLVEQLLALGAKGVALDLVLPVQSDVLGDQRLASLAAHTPLVLGQVLDFEERDTHTANGYPAGGRAAGAGDGDLPRATGFVGNHAGLQNAKCIGHIGVRLDRDGVLRHLPILARLDNRVYASLGLALMACASPQQAELAFTRLSGVTHGTWRLPFRKSLGAFASAPAEDVLLGQVDPRLVRDRYVLVGASAVGLSDHVATPLHPLTAGVLVHAQTLAELQAALSASPAGRGPSLSTTGVLVLALCAAALLAALLPWSLSMGVAAVAATCGGWLWLASASFGLGGSVPVLPPLSAWLGTAVSWAVMDFAATRAASRKILQVLAPYVAAPVLQALVRQGLKGTLQPARREITVLVADMAGYTQLTAESSLEDSARLTTDFLAAISTPVLASGATLDRYTGDGLIAFWGAPLARPDHAEAAIHTARHMLGALEAFNTRRAASGQQPVAMRMGIESGEALVGDLGTSSRSVYTAVGTCINLASRLQEAAKEVGVSVLIGPQTAAQVSPDLIAHCTRHAIRGLRDPIELYTLQARP